jgi:hypothetical protein
VVESPADERVPERIDEIERLMKDGMLMVVPAMNVKVETVVTLSLNKADLDPRYLPEAQPQAPQVVSDPTGPASAGEVAGSATGVGSPAP